MISPLVSFDTVSKPQGQPQVGGLVTVVDYAGRRICGRLMRHDVPSGNVWVKVVGFDTKPYMVGDVFARDLSDIIDWD